MAAYVGRTIRGNEILWQLATACGQPHQGYFNFTYQRFDEAEGQVGILVSACDVTGLVQARKALTALPGGASAAH